MRFRYLDGKTGKRMDRILSGTAFPHLVLQHLPPKGFRRARNYGFLHPNSKHLIALLQVLLKVAPNPCWIMPRPPLTCPCYGAPMRVLRRQIPPSAVPHPPEVEAIEGVTG